MGHINGRRSATRPRDAAQGKVSSRLRGLPALSAVEAAEAELALLRLHLSLAVRRWLRRSGLTWNQLEERMGASSVGMRAIEGLDATVSIDLLTRALLALGARQRDIALEIVRYTAEDGS